VTAGCHRVIAVSPEIRDYLLEVAGYQPDNVVAIPNGVDLKRFDPAAVTALHPLELWGFDDKSPLIGIIGRLDPQKDHENFLAAARLVCDDFPAARFVVVGEGPLRQQLEKLAGDLGLENQVRFTGIMRNMPELLATLDLVVFSSRWEGLPVALLEALAMNRAVVATSVGGIPGLINHEQTGLLVPPGDPEALAHSILTLLRGPDFAQQVANQGRSLIQAGFSVTSMHNKILAIYTAVQAKTITTPDQRP
jgi:glycosyltransferase involved in cell wall biosynthesis